MYIYIVNFYDDGPRCMVTVEWLSLKNVLYINLNANIVTWYFIYDC